MASHMILPHLLQVSTQMHLLVEAFPGLKLQPLTISSPCVPHHFFPALPLYVALVAFKHLMFTYWFMSVSLMCTPKRAFVLVFCSLLCFQGPE